jgi:hypothetical protein
MGMKKMREDNQSSLITASEIGHFVYCEMAWHLKRRGDFIERTEPEFHWQTVWRVRPSCSSWQPWFC